LEGWQETRLKEKLLQRYGKKLRKLLISGTKALAIVDGIRVPETEDSDGWTIMVQNVEPSTSEWNQAKELFSRD
jgi:hypothetical protein